MTTQPPTAVVPPSNNNTVLPEPVGETAILKLEEAASFKITIKSTNFCPIVPATWVPTPIATAVAAEPDAVEGVEATAVLDEAEPIIKINLPCEAIVAADGDVGEAFPNIDIDMGTDVEAAPFINPDAAATAPANKEADVEPTARGNTDVDIPDEPAEAPEEPVLVVGPNGDDDDDGMEPDFEPEPAAIMAEDNNDDTVTMAAVLDAGDDAGAGSLLKPEPVAIMAEDEDIDAETVPAALDTGAHADSPTQEAVAGFESEPASNATEAVTTEPEQDGGEPAVLSIGADVEGPGPLAAEDAMALAVAKEQAAKVPALKTEVAGKDQALAEALATIKAKEKEIGALKVELGKKFDPTVTTCIFCVIVIAAFFYILHVVRRPGGND